MATRTFYILGTAATAPGWGGNLQDGGSAPTAANSAFGWQINKLPINFYQARLGATAVATTTGQSTSFISGASGPTVGTGSGATTAGDFFTIPNPLTGTFAAGAWTLSLMLRASTAGCVGHLNMRVWASVNQNGSSARELTSGSLVGTAVTLSTTADVNGMGTTGWSPGALTLNNEYLFFQMEWQETTTGGSNGDNVFFRVNTALITTTNFVSNWAGSATLTPAAAQVVNEDQWYAGAANLAASSLFGGNATRSSMLDSAELLTASGNFPSGAPASLVALFHFDGADGSTTFTDSTGRHTLTPSGTAQLDNAQVEFGATSLLLDGSGSAITDSSSDFAFAGDFTVDFWVYFNDSFPHQNILQLDGSVGNAVIYVSTRIIRLWNFGEQITGSTTISSTTWHHIALTRAGSSTRLFLDGTQQGSTWTDSSTYAGVIGISTQSGIMVVGWLDELRVLNGLAAWTSNFTPPSSPYAAGAGIAAAALLGATAGWPASSSLGANATISGVGPTIWQGGAILAAAAALSANSIQRIQVLSNWAAIAGLSAAVTGGAVITAWSAAATFYGGNQPLYSPALIGDWMTHDLTVIGGQLAPDGSLSAYDLIEDTATGVDHYLLGPMTAFPDLSSPSAPTDPPDIVVSGL